MKILHVAHYDLNLASDKAFVDNVSNGLEKFLTSMLENLRDISQYIVMFEEDIHKINVMKLDESGKINFYTQYNCEKFNEENFNHIFQDVIEKLAIDIVHYHYQKDFVKLIPACLSELNVKQIATIHDESYLAENFGEHLDYKREQSVSDFFTPLEQIIFPHEVVCGKYVQYYPEIENKVMVINNGVTLPHVARVNTDEKLKIVFFGGINKFKGADIVEEIVQRERDNFSFHLLGMIEKDNVQFESESTYNNNEVSEKMGAINPDVVVISSVVQEVYPYTGIEATSLGYPIVAFSVGSLAALEKESRGFVVDKISADAMIEKFYEISNHKNEDLSWWENVLDEVSTATISDEETMAKRYEALYNIVVSDEKNEPADLAYFQMKNYADIRAMMKEEKELQKQLILLKHENEIRSDLQTKMTQQFSYLREHPWKTLVVSLLDKIGVKKID